MEIHDLINGEAALAILRKKLDAELMEAAEPVIDEALQRVEQQMRRALGRCVVSLLEHGFDCYRDRSQLVITVKLPETTS